MTKGRPITKQHPPYNEFLAQAREKMLEMKEQKVPLEEIAKKFKCTVGQVNKLLRTASLRHQHKYY